MITRFDIKVIFLTDGHNFESCMRVAGSSALQSFCLSVRENEQWFRYVLLLISIKSCYRSNFSRVTKSACIGETTGCDQVRTQEPLKMLFAFLVGYLPARCAVVWAAAVNGKALVGEPTVFRVLNFSKSETVKRWEHRNRQQLSPCAQLCCL